MDNNALTLIREAFKVARNSPNFIEDYTPNVSPENMGQLSVLVHMILLLPQPVPSAEEFINSIPVAQHAGSRRRTRRRRSRR